MKTKVTAGLAAILWGTMLAYLGISALGFSIEFAQNEPIAEIHTEKVACGMQSEPLTELASVPSLPQPEIAVEQQPAAATYDGEYDIPIDAQTQDYIIEICKEYQVDPVLAFAVMQVESNFTPDAVSKTGDYGVMQINKVNHQGYEKLLGITDFLDIKQGALAGIYMPWDLREHYGCDTEEKMLMAYNRGIGKARKLWEQGIFHNTYTDHVAKAKAEIRKN